MENNNTPVANKKMKDNVGNSYHHSKKHRRRPHKRTGEQPDASKINERGAATQGNSSEQDRGTHQNNNHKHHHKNNNNKLHRKQKTVQNNEVTDLIVDNESPKTILNTEIDEKAETIQISEADTQTTETEIKKVDIIGIRFKAGGKTYYFDPNGIVGKRGEYAIVETARGQEYGEISIENSTVPETEIVPPLRPVLRIATDADTKHNEENRKKEDEAFKICNEKIISHQLDMKLIDVQYTFDNSKLLFYFTSSGRVDFRELVKDLASVFRTRIELRQIGIRDEAKLIGGLGICGRPLCCALFLSDFGQVSIKMAKEQNLSLNSTKISGACGRLMCCLRYEHETYVDEIKKTPPVDSYVSTPDGNGTVVEISPLAGKVKVRLDEKPDQTPKTYTRDTVTILTKNK